MNLQEESREIFVPGRLCILGEHSDWAGRNREFNSAIEPGMAIVSGIEQGIHAWIEKNNKFEVISELCGERKSFSMSMSVRELRKTAEEGGYFSYMAGTASYMKEHYHVGGVKIRIDDMTLPMKKGLSSSAAICVLVVKAFNILYDLKMSTHGIMQAAYRGEQRTPSRCGRLDQACAYGVKPVVMIFDGSEMDVEQLVVHENFYWVFANLNASKDTIKILADLSKCYPFAQDATARRLQEALGVKNQEIIRRAVAYFESGDVKAMGRLLTEAQELFDTYIAPVCPSQLTAPVLHSVLNDVVVQNLTYGAKGVGSQGDGMAQFLAKDKESQKELICYLTEKRGMDAYGFTIRRQRRIRKAIIPVAGFGTRAYPETRVTKKEFFPVVDKDNLIKPALMILLEELDRAGIDKICLVIGKEDQEMYKSYFERSLSEEHLQKLPEQMKSYEDRILKIGSKLQYVIQEERKGFGHAVYQCREFAGNQSVLLLLGDTLYESCCEISCIEQLLDAYEKEGKLAVGLAEIPVEQTGRYGIVSGKWEDTAERLMKVSAIVEKPSIETAEDSLSVMMANGEKKYFMIFGNYVLTPEVFNELGKSIEAGKMRLGEYQLTDALDAVRGKYGMIGYRIDGRAYDIGNPAAYRKTVSEFGIQKKRK